MFSNDFVWCERGCQNRRRRRGHRGKRGLSESQRAQRTQRTQKEEGIGIGGVVGVFAQTGKFVGQRREGAEEHRRKRECQNRRGRGVRRGICTNWKVCATKKGGHRGKRGVSESQRARKAQRTQKEEGIGGCIRVYACTCIYLLSHWFFIPSMYSGC